MFEVSCIGILGVIVFLTIVSLFLIPQAFGAEKDFIVGAKLVKKTDELFDSAGELDIAKP